MAPQYGERNAVLIRANGAGKLTELAFTHILDD